MEKYAKPYQMLNEIVTEREPFNEDLLFFREREDVKEHIVNLLKSLEVLKGIEFIDCEVSNLKDIYQNKKEDHELTSKEIKELENLTKWNKGVSKSENSHYPLVSIKNTRLIEIKFKMKFSDNKSSEICEYTLYYPELIDGQYFIINDNKFFPVFQLDEAEYYKRSDNSIVLKTALMPIKIRGIKDDFMDYDNKINNGIPIKARKLELCLFDKNINIFKYYFAKYGLEGTMKFFSLDENCEVIKEKITLIERKEGYLYFGMTPKLSLKVDQKWFEELPQVRSNLIYTLLNAFKGKNIKIDMLENLEYWKRQLGRSFTGNSSKTLEKSQSVIISLERLLDQTTKNNLRHQESEKKDVYHIMRSMILEFENIIRMDSHNLANKRIRLTEYLIYNLVKKLSKTVYRLVTLNNPSIGKLKQIFSNISPNYIIESFNSIDLLRYSSNVNTIDLFTRILKGSKSGPQSTKTDNGSPNLGLRGFDPSYLGNICIVSTGSGDPGISFTLTPFAKIHDPNNHQKFFFADKPYIKDFGKVNYSELPEINIEDEIEIIEDGE